MKFLLNFLILSYLPPLHAGANRSTHINKKHELSELVAYQYPKRRKSQSKKNRYSKRKRQRRKSRSRHNRERSPHNASIGFNLLFSSYHLKYSRKIKRREFLELSYLNHPTIFPELNEYIKNEMYTFEAGWKKFATSSFYYRGSISYENTNIEGFLLTQNSAEGFDANASAGSKVTYHLIFKETNLNFGMSIGNEWRLANQFKLGVEWLHIGHTILNLSRTQRYKIGYIPANGEFRPIVEESFDSPSGLRLRLLNFELGYSF